MTSRFRIVAGIILVILVTAAAVIVFIRQQISKSFPIDEGMIGLAGLERDVTVNRDRFGVPVVTARSEHDLMFALGFTHAQDRLWQMDLGRRAGMGRLSEVFGDKTVPFDKMFRIIGIHEIVRDVERSLSGDSRDILQWYADGVNAFRDEQRGKYAVEFDLLGYEPEPWTISHSLILAQMMAWELNLSWWTDVTFGSITDRVGLEKALDIFPVYPEKIAPTVDGSALREVATMGQEMLDVMEQYRSLFGLTSPAFGSNAWAISPEKSASGSVILANDPHLHLQLPSKWYEVYLRAPGYDVGGMSIPGVPGIVIGHNNEIAWGLTNLMADESDFYVEKMDSAGGTQYYHAGRWLPIKTRFEDVTVKGGEVIQLVVRSTHHGPVVSDVRTPLQKSTPTHLITMRWTGAEVGDRIRAFNKINRAGNWTEFLVGVSDFTGPGQNFVYGDKKGNIGYIAGGLIPIRGKGSSTIPLPGWESSADWKGFVPFDRLPRSYNPPEGFVATANNKVAGPGFPYHISDIWEPASRIQRLRQTLGQPSLFSVGDFERLQNDRFSFFAMELVPHLLADLVLNRRGSEEEKRAVEYLRNWNFEFREADIATAIFQQLFVRLLYNIYADEMGEDLFHDFVILGNIPIRVTQRLIEEHESAWFDDVSTTGTVEGQGDIIRKSMGETISLLKNRFGNETKNWRWGEMHTLTIPHPFGRVKPLDRIFNVGPFPMAGGSTTVMSAEYSFNDPFSVTVASSFRMIFDFATPDEVRSVLPSGQSGHVFHENYLDQTTLWLNGSYRTVRVDSTMMVSPGWKRLLLKATR